MTELDNILAAYNMALQNGRRVALATIVKVSGSTYRRPGARMLVTEDGHLVGTLSGGCLEGDVAGHARQVFESGVPRLITYDSGTQEDLLWGLGLGCNGEVHILIEPLSPDQICHPLEFLSNRLRARRPGVLATVFALEGQWERPIGGHLVLFPDASYQETIGYPLGAAVYNGAKQALALGCTVMKRLEYSEGTADVLLEYVSPPPSLFVFGAGFDAVPVARLAKHLGWYVTVVDHRPAFANREQFPQADEVILAHPESICDHCDFDNRTLAVIMTHNYAHDRELLKILLPSPVCYIGLLGPKKRAARLLEELRESGVTPTAQQLKRLHSPAGLDIGADSPEEIALAILGEMQARLTGRSGGALRDRAEPIHDPVGRLEARVIKPPGEKLTPGE